MADQHNTADPHTHPTTTQPTQPTPAQPTHLEPDHHEPQTQQTQTTHTQPVSDNKEHHQEQQHTTDQHQHHFTVESAFESQQGPRMTMEDAHVVIDNLNDVKEINPPLDKGLTRQFYAVYDGHGGISSAHTAEHVLHLLLVNSEEFKKGDIKTAIINAYKQTDHKILSDNSYVRDGSTAVTVLILGNKLYLANCGDSECVIAKKQGDIYIAELLSKKHSPDDPDERQRIEDAGGRVILGRVMGSLAVARALGDSEYKTPNNRAQHDYVTSDPFVKEYDLTPENEFLILACDGLWDKLTYDNAVQFIASYKKDKRPALQTAKDIVALALNKGSMDNVTSIIVYFNWQ